MKKVRLLIIFLCLVAILPSLNFFINQQQTKIQQQKQNDVNEEIKYWEKIIEESPTYRDAYVQLAIGYWQLGALPQARENLQRAQQLDPYWVPPPALLPLLP